MTAMRVEVRTCPKCHEPIGRFFRYCQNCAEVTPAIASATVVSPPSANVQKTPKVVLPPQVISPPVIVPGALDETKAQTIAPGSRMTVAAGRHRSLSTSRLGVGGLVLVVAVGMIAASSWWKSRVPEIVEVRVDADQWQGVDLRAKLGAGKAFVVMTDVPLRLRTATGRPITTMSGPVSLGELGDGKVEVKAVSGTARVTFAAR